MNLPNWYRKQSVRRKIFIPFFAISLLTSSLFTVYGFFQNTRAIVNEIDKRLLIAALTMEQLLPRGYFDRIDGPGSVGDEDHVHHSEMLFHFLENVGGTYLYALFKDDQGKYRFVASADPDWPFWTEYEEPAPNIFEIEADWRPHVSTTQDPEYGLVRSVVIPHVDANGRRFIFGADIFASQVDALKRRAFLNFFVMGAASFLMAILFSYAASLAITRPLSRLSSFTRRLAESDFASTLRLDADLLRDGDDTRAETAILAFDFDTMQRRLEAHIQQLKITQSARERAESELRIAGQIQETFLPDAFSPAPFAHPVRLHAAMKTAKQAGGDLYDFFALDPSHLFFAIGDVSGKGMPAAMFMSAVVVLLRSAAKLSRDPADILRRVNDDLADRNESCTFVTLLAGVLDLSTGDVLLANGGHNPPRILAPDGAVSTLPVKPNGVVGVMPGKSFPDQSFSIRPGESLFLYTDGVTEAMDEADALYGDDRMDALLSSLPPGALPADVLRVVNADLAAFGGQREQADDITLLCIQRPPSA
jgi:serine phosphatase RsbU (regulator of sigma subunit)